ncbi:hypothetical protein [Pseudomonas sp. NBRC 100443]|uniref:hypothetical protein n=1 Tax=Pseudomonas sp. NBRC 100443 TaxID=1113665 RepID=UPI0025561D0E|nr:hypothetical protein [Pseudomonas sp. NBRC 100443]
MRKSSRFVIGSFLVLALSAIAVLYFGRLVTDSGRNDSKWIREDMWRASYFNKKGKGLAESDLTNILSIQPGASEDEAFVDYVGKDKCEVDAAVCNENNIEIANLLIDSGHAESALKLLERVRKRLLEMHVCPIEFESSLLRYKEKQLSGYSPEAARKEAAAVINRIRMKGGVIYDLRTESCDSLAREKPELFHEYVIISARIMQMGDVELFKAGAFIESVNSVRY